MTSTNLFFVRAPFFVGKLALYTLDQAVCQAQSFVDAYGEHATVETANGTVLAQISK